MIEYTNEDCMVGMKRYPDKYFDLAIVDPPYGIGNFSQSDAVHRDVKWNDSIPSTEYFQELKRVSRRRIIWGANYYNCFEGGNGAIVWYKNVGHPDMSHCEIASVSWQVRVGFIWINWSGGIKSQRSIHPCEKPVDLYKWTLSNYDKPGDLILDTHVGSASSLIACHDMGFDAVGFELDADYYRASKQRLEDFMRQPRIDSLTVEAREQIGLEASL